LVTGAARGLGYEFCRAFVDSCVFFCLHIRRQRQPRLNLGLSGCTKLAILDLRGDEAKEAAGTLTSYLLGQCKSPA
jgi:NAD(P)-dependent dehydrogenase (short-subunit alcohol dehydrogenase family)